EAEAEPGPPRSGPGPRPAGPARGVAPRRSLVRRLVAPRLAPPPRARRAARTGAARARGARHRRCRASWEIPAVRQPGPRAPTDHPDDDPPGPRLGRSLDGLKASSPRRATRL